MLECCSIRSGTLGLPWLLHTFCVRSCCTWRAVWRKQQQKRCQDGVCIIDRGQPKVSHKLRILNAEARIWGLLYQYNNTLLIIAYCLLTISLLLCWNGSLSTSTLYKDSRTSTRQINWRGSFSLTVICLRPSAPQICAMHCVASNKIHPNLCI